MAWSTGAIHGRLARVAKGGTSTAVAATYIDYTSDFALQWSRDVATVQRQGQEYKETFAGQAGWTGSINLCFIRSSTVEAGALQGLAVSTALNPATAVSTDIHFCLGTTMERIEGDFWVTGYSITAAVGDVVRASLSITGHSAIEFSSVKA